MHLPAHFIDLEVPLAFLASERRGSRRVWFLTGMVKASLLSCLCFLHVFGPLLREYELRNEIYILDKRVNLKNVTQSTKASITWACASKISLLA